MHRLRRSEPAQDAARNRLRHPSSTSHKGSSYYGFIPLRFHAHWRRIIGIYLFVLYGLGLLSFTLYPMPDNPVEFCRTHHLSPQLTPLTFINDVTNEGLRATLQAVMNVAFFIPLGVFARLLLRWKFIPTLISAIAASLAIETAQLTGAFGLYPCSYRLFDIDELIINTFGSVLGYSLALLIPRKELERAKKDDIVTEAGALRRLVGFIIDNALATARAMLISIPFYLFNKELGIDAQPVLHILPIALFHFAVPFLGKGRTVGGRVTRMTLDNKPRTPVRRLLLYILRLIWISSFILASYYISFIIGVVTVIIWLVKKRLPYAIA